jgi:Family of unknown function (DUF6338)
MVNTLEALAVFLIAILPGAMYVWGIESVTGAWGLNWADRVLRFIAFSAIIHVLISPLTYKFWNDYIATNYFGQGKELTLGMYEAAIAYVIVPFIVGRIVGHGAVAGNTWALRFAGRRPGAPRSWDHLFQANAQGWVILCMKSGTFLAGLYSGPPNGLTSYASAYPDTQELFLYTQVLCDPETGEFWNAEKLPLEEGQNPVLTHTGLLVRWDEIEYLEWISA